MESCVPWFTWLLNGYLLSTYGVQIVVGNSKAGQTGSCVLEAFNGVGR